MGRNRTLNLSNVSIKGTLTFATNYKEFPMYPEIGEVALVLGALYVYTELDGIKTWYQLTERRDTYFHIQGENRRKWIINHNFKTEACTFFVYIDRDLSSDYKITYQDATTIELTFDKVCNGTVTVFKFPEINTFDVTTETSTVRDHLKWRSGYANINKFPDAGNHSGMVTIARDTGNLYYSTGNEWIKVTTTASETALVDSIMKKIDNRFDLIDYNTLLNKPQLNNLPVEWRQIQNKPDLNNNDYNTLKNKPKLVYSKEITVDNQGKLVYDFQTRSGVQIFINREWVQLYCDGLLVSPSKYEIHTDSQIRFNSGLELGSELLLVTIG